jgi:NAD(P)-dependent dehydrogenase (short-subunit alcohol dehydrogenase family)
LYFAFPKLVACVKFYKPSPWLLTILRPRVDVLANVAGIMDNFSGADTVTDVEWSKVLTVNLTAPMKMMRAVLVHMKEAKSGAIVNVSSKAGMSGGAAGIAYTTSKHGLVSFLLF